MKSRQKISFGLILLTIGIISVQLIIQHVTVYSKLYADIEEVVDINEDSDESNEKNTEEGPEENTTENDDQILFDLGQFIRMVKVDTKKRKVKDTAHKILCATPIIFDNPPELKV